MNCEHHSCRCARARELVAIYDRTGDVQYLRSAIDVHEQKVKCREIATSDQMMFSEPLAWPDRKSGMMTCPCGSDTYSGMLGSLECDNCGRPFSQARLHQ